ncbi:MAG: 50S ribosomal protein L5 [Candidatus Abawacabacteria bacterium RBG_16_42_10]|uniref:Large ribosomal subunit protein uL5 n=1 Tax=Candidatus Abawacabacteria bacterium RBG_16_42_10 TaxID=1817814 RepID=A0A1F4XI44_9BACT|nr:ribosomal protein L5 [uncultured bacterium]OGC81397.1 MAG: 50S ribosomal protein L5 [Candidatus Abawacabacteria bacterium RBG_16_42_10]
MFMKLQKTYFEKVVPLLKKELSEDNINALPRLEKIIVNVGIGSMHTKQGIKDFSGIEKNIAAMTGQRPVTIQARKSVSNFKLREGTPNGMKVTLRGERMYDFLSKLINIALPRVRDFRGVTIKSFDPKGNYSMGMKENIVFPEIKLEEDGKQFGLEITIVIKNSDPEKSALLLRHFRFPFKEKPLN